MRLHYRIKGMSCAACGAHVEKAIGRVTGENDIVSVSLLTNSVSLIVSEDTNREALEERLSASV